MVRLCNALVMAAVGFVGGAVAIVLFSAFIFFFGMLAVEICSFVFDFEVPSMALAPHDGAMAWQVARAVVGIGAVAGATINFFTRWKESS